MRRIKIFDIARRTAANNSITSSTVTATSAKAEPFVNGTNANYVDQMYSAWMEDPHSVHRSWAAYFSQVNAGVPPGSAYVPPPEYANSLIHPAALPINNMSQNMSTGMTQHSSSGNISSKDADSSVAVQRLIRAYQVRGHHLAELDPLGILDADLDSSTPEEILSAESFFTQADMAKTYDVSNMNTSIGGAEGVLPLETIIARLKNAYCNSIAVEYMHIGSKEQCDFIRERIENPEYRKLSDEDRIINYKRILQAEKFETFLQKKWSSEKRFGLEGVEAMIASTKAVIDVAVEDGVESVIMGMPHRGRLNVLANIVRKDFSTLFTQFNSELETDDLEMTGDVKYHLGINHERLNYKTNKMVNLAVCANPSHLEAVDPVVQGKTRAEQYYREDHEGDRVMSVLFHGDAAFSGQGVVYETFSLSDLPQYTTHGTIHIVANNQIGFTTDPRFSRSSPYCTDVARVVGAPILHVNADDADAVMVASKVAAEFRQRFKKDVVLDIVGYRRHGHNEIDNPMFTQPLMYQKISEHPTVLAAYTKQLIDEGVLTVAKAQAAEAEYEAICEEGYRESKNSKQLCWSHWLDSPWKGFFEDDQGTIRDYFPATGVSKGSLELVGSKISEQPKGFALHGGLKRILKARGQLLQDGKVNWALGEAMAYGTLLMEGVHVRVSGQDVERGTFSHRHAVLHDQAIDGKTYCPLQHLTDDQAGLTICNSSLSEYGVLGFELGYSMVNPNSLIIWEAQFGDFSNTAQPIIDQFISSGEVKWVRQSGLVMLLPHGYEGMGPEHSSARLERFLAMMNDDPDELPAYMGDSNFNTRSLHDCNWIITNITTPANFFHALRRQIKMPFRKPMINMSPKSGLNHPRSRSDLSEMADGTEFLRIIEDPTCVESDKCKRIIFCTGKVYIDIEEERKKLGLDQGEVAVVRIEQIAPFPFDLVKEQLDKYPGADVYWSQEEHKNSGAYEYCKQRIRTVSDFSRRVHYAGRASSASTATGSKQTHKKELKKFLGECFKNL